MNYLKVFGRDAAKIWAALGGDAKSRFASLAKMMNKRYKDSLNAIEQAFHAYSKKSPLGSVCRDCPLDYDEVCERRWEPDSELVKKWAIREIELWVPI